MMARSLNFRCNFQQGFFTCDLLVDAVELIVHVETKCGKHTLKEDKEKYRPWAKQTDNDGSKHALDSLTPNISSDSGAWFPTHQFDYKPKLFKDPRYSHSDKENMPPLESAPMPILNRKENDFLDRTEKLLGKDNH